MSSCCFAGVGCTANYEDSWIAHQDDFNAILASLNNSHLHKDDSKKKKKVEKRKDGSKDDLNNSLEEKSKKSRARVQ